MVARRKGLGLLAAALTWAGAAAAYDLGQHQWRDRLLLLVAPSPDDPAAVAQRRWRAQRAAAVEDRDLEIVRLYRDHGYVGERSLDAAAVAALRQRLELPADARLLILVGKDGGVKRRAPLDTDAAELFRQIDGMPMRQAEIRAKRRAGEAVTPAD